MGSEHTSKEYTDNLHEAYDAPFTEGSRWGGRLSSFVVRKSRLCTVTLYLTAGEIGTLSIPLQFSVSLLCKIRLPKGCCEDQWRWVSTCVLSAFSLFWTLNAAMGKGFLISPTLLSRFSHLIVFAKDLFCSLRVRSSERGKLCKGFAHLWELRQRGLRLQWSSFTF